jgi:hypothetical protein
MEKKKKEKLLEKASDYCFEMLSKVNDDAQKLDIPFQTVVVVYTAQGVIDNGGFQYFFENDFPGSPPYSLFTESYKQIGAIKAADNIDRAVKMFGFKNPHLNQKKRNKFLDKNDSEDCEFIKLGDELCGDETIWDLLADFVIKNQIYFDL